MNFNYDLGKTTNILDLVGNTPLFKLSKISGGIKNAVILAKAEFLNPTGSVKDRAAFAMLRDGVDSGKLSAGKTIIDATSGNTGISYAMLGAALGFRVVLYIPKNASEERKNIIRSYGAKIVETNPIEGSDGAFLAVNTAYSAKPSQYFYPDQYNNEINPLTHYNTTGVEIWEQSGGKVTHFVTGVGTSGTFMGVSRRLKEYNPNIKTYIVQPNSPFHGIEGIKHMDSTIRPGFYSDSAADGTLGISTEEAYSMTRRLAREEGLFVGISSGANAAAAVKLAKKTSEKAVVVTLLCDSGVRYISDSFWSAS
jgi:cysteine synthase B